MVFSLAIYLRPRHLDPKRIETGTDRVSFLMGIGKTYCCEIESIKLFSFSPSFPSFLCLKTESLENRLVNIDIDFRLVKHFLSSHS